LGEVENEKDIAVLSSEFKAVTRDIDRLDKRLEKTEGTLKALAMSVVAIVIAAVLKQAGLGQ
jgi:hypothetical protein